MAPPTPKSADLTKQGKAQKQNITVGTFFASEVHSSPTVAACVWRCWENSKWDAGSPRLPQVKDSVGGMWWGSAKARGHAVWGHLGHAPSCPGQPGCASRRCGTRGFPQWQRQEKRWRRLHFIAKVRSKMAVWPPGGSIPCFLNR